MAGQLCSSLAARFSPRSNAGIASGDRSSNSFCLDTLFAAQLADVELHEAVDGIVEFVFLVGGKLRQTRREGMWLPRRFGVQWFIGSAKDRQQQREQSGVHRSHPEPREGTRDERDIHLLRRTFRNENPRNTRAGDAARYRTIQLYPPAAGVATESEWYCRHEMSVGNVDWMQLPSLLFRNVYSRLDDRHAEAPSAPLASGSPTGLPTRTG